MTDTATAAPRYAFRPYPQTFAAGAGPALAGKTLTRWEVYDRKLDRVVAGGIQTEADAAARVERLIDDATPTEVRFANGRSRRTTKATAAMVVGLDDVGHLVVESPDWPGHLYGLTLCCEASGKGGGGGVICRSCYRDVDWSLGGPATVAVARLT